MVRFLVLIGLFVCLISCSFVYNKKHFAFKDVSSEKNIKTKGYYYHIYDLGKSEGVYINMIVLLGNNYVYIVRNGFGDRCGDSITLDCAIKMSEYMLDKNINDFLVDTDKQSNRIYHIWNWGKYQISNDTITIKWFYNRFGDYYLAEEKGIVKDSTTISLYYFKDYKTKKDTIYKEFKNYYFKPYLIEEMYKKTPKKLIEIENNNMMKNKRK